MSEHIKYPKIPQFRDVAYEVKRQASYQGLDEQGEPIYAGKPLLPEISFTGTVKLHGTNAGVQFTEAGDIIYQSRNRIISVGDDNAGFAAWMTDRVGHLERQVLAYNEAIKSATVYGEFIGQGIQAGVAVSELDKTFVVFGIRSDDQWLDLRGLTLDSSLNLYCIRDFPEYTISVDFERPEIAINQIHELTQAVEAECPVGKALGISGIGEGIVWVNDEHNLLFKSKGDKHSNSKVKTHKPVDLEAITAVRTLAEGLMTERRLAQGFEYLEEMSLEPIMRNLGAYLKYTVSDCVAEEKLAIEASGIESKVVGKALMEIAKRHYINSAS